MIVAMKPVCGGLWTVVVLFRGERTESAPMSAGQAEALIGRMGRHG